MPSYITINLLFAHAVSKFVVALFSFTSFAYFISKRKLYKVVALLEHLRNVGLF